MDGLRAVRVVGLQVVVVDRVDAEQLVLPLEVDFLRALPSWPVRQVTLQADAESPDAELRLRMILRYHLPPPDGVVVWTQPDCLPRWTTVPLVQLVWFAERPQDLLRELRYRCLSVAQLPFASAAWRRLQARKNQDQVPDRPPVPETWLRD